jgi:hypothetical protein
MPCYDSRDEQERDLAARTACAVLTVLEAQHNDLSFLPPECLNWWKRHKEHDHDRRWGKCPIKLDVPD